MTVLEPIEHRDGSELDSHLTAMRRAEMAAGAFIAGSPYVAERVAQDGECLTWIGSRDRNGYPRGYFDGRTQLAHRWVYAQLVGPIPEGLTLDHLCRNRSCVNPAHLEAVTQRENTLRGTGPTAVNARKTHCDQGHELGGDNLIPGSKTRGCRICHVERNRVAAREYQRRRRAALKAAG